MGNIEDAWAVWNSIFRRCDVYVVEQQPVSCETSKIIYIVLGVYYPCMGVVRREGDWRLEKLDDGHYEVTFKKHTELEILTPGYDPGPYSIGSVGFNVREVDSFEEVVGLFEENANGPSPLNIGEGLSLSNSNTQSPSDADNVELTPGIVAIALLLTGGFFVYAYWPAYASKPFQIGALLLVLGLAILGWAATILRGEGWQAGIDFLATPLFEESRNGSSRERSSNRPTTPPAPQRLKEEIIFDRANHHCEWCGVRFDGLQVHHIQPRSEGGPNTKRNLVALCPNCHDQADRGGISKTQLKGKVRRIMANEA